MAEISAKVLPDGYSYDWSSMSYQEQSQGGALGILLGLSVLFGYLFLVGLYESWMNPFAVLSSVTVAALGAIATVSAFGITNNLSRRIRMHNGEIKGGAKYTRLGRPWFVAAFVSGFRTQRETLMFEWA